MSRIAFVLLLGLHLVSVAHPARANEAEQVDFFERKIRPVLVERCYKCHSLQADKAEGGLLLDTREAIREGGESGAAIVPHKPQASLLLEAIRYESLEMPPNEKLPPAVVADFESWIKQGAIDPREKSGSDVPSSEPPEIDFEAARKFWAFQSPRSHNAPKVEQSDWPRSKIDAFVLAAMENESLSPATPADRRTLARRVYYDLVGLPPTPEELDEFLGDRSDSAYESLVDRLLSSQRFGEKWARLWLDVARFAEDQAHIVGNNKSLFFPNAYLYRDWVINAFNDDLPYNEFVRRQLAADLIPDLNDGEKAALGFMGLGPKYYRRNDPEVMADEWEDRVDTISRGLLGLTVACARCHDHKFDPIATEDYYALAGIFASTQMYNAPFGDEGKKKEEKNSKDAKSKAPNGAMHIVREGKPQNVKVQIRGNVRALGEEVPRGFLRILSHESQRQSFTQGSGRLELADAIAHRDNPLTARVFVNRIWGQLFGQHLVGTPSNFGVLGQRPSHPELLDDLAVRFMDEGWSMKKLIREIVLSSTYRQSSIASKESLRRDPENCYLSRTNRRRLPVEGWRDGVLAATGRISDVTGGPSIDIDDPEQTRRTIYSRVSRFELNPMLSMFDFPDPNVHAARRVETTTALQRLFHLNSPFVVAHAEHLAQRVSNHESNTDGQVAWIYKLLFSRTPDDEEIALAKGFLDVSEDDRQQRWQEYAQLLLISNEMMYLD